MWIVVAVHLSNREPSQAFGPFATAELAAEAMVEVRKRMPNEWLLETVYVSLFCEDKMLYCPLPGKWPGHAAEMARIANAVPRDERAQLIRDTLQLLHVRDTEVSALLG